MPKPYQAVLTTKPKPRRRLRRLLWACGFLILLIVLAPLAVGLGPVRDMIEDEIGAELGRKIEIADTRAFWGSGIDVEGITIHSPDGFDGPLATIAKVHVDLDVFALIGGSIVAQVRVIEPHVTLRTNEGGQGNEEGVIERWTAQEAEPPEDEAPPQVDLTLTLIGGRLETSAGVIDGLQVQLALDPGGSVQADLQALVKEAGRDGKDAPITLEVDLDAEGAGPMRCEVPPLDLSRLARVVESATGFTGLQGTASVHVDVLRHADETLAGTVGLRFDEFRAVSAEHARLAFARLGLTAEMKSAEHATATKLQVQVNELRVERRAGPTRESFREPSISFLGDGVYDAAGGRLRIETARFDAGKTASAQALTPLRVETDPLLRIQGKAKARVDLQRLGELRGLVPALEPLAGGVLDANFEGRGGGGIDAGVNLMITALRLRPTDWAPEGYVDPRIILKFDALHGERDGTRINLRKLTSKAIHATFAHSEGLALTRDPHGHTGMDGPFQVRIDLASVSRLAGRALGLERGESIRGYLELTGSGRGEGEQLSVNASVAATGVRMPASWSEIRTPARLQARLSAERQADDAEVTLSDLRGMGLSGEGTLSLVQRAEGVRLTAAAATLGVDLAAARPWLGGLFGLDAQERLAGHLTSSIRLGEAGDGKRLVAGAQLVNLDWVRSADAMPVREPLIELHADVLLAAEGGRHLAEELRLESAGLKLDLAGSSYVSEPDVDLDGTIRVGGDAARLAPLVGALLGEGYEDLRGLGPIDGRARVSGSPAENGRSLIVDGRLGLASWNTAGLDLSKVTLEAKRAHLEDPLTASFKAGINKGTARVDVRARLGGPAVPWSGTVKIARVDTSGVLVSQGAGRLLAFALPALLPAGKKTPVLSGLLDADLEGGAPSVVSPAMEDGLHGQGRVHMSGGEIKQSTLFGGSDKGGFAKIVSILKVAVPAAGRALQDLSRALTFSTLDSRFRVADRVLTLEEAKLIGQSANIDMQGRVDFEQRVAVNANVVLQGGGGKALAKVLPGGAIPLKVGGTLEDPEVRPALDLGKLAAGGLGGKLPGLLDDLKKKKKLPGGIPNPFK